MSSENKSLPKATYDIQLTSEALQSIEQLAAVNYSPRKIALYLQVSERGFMALWKNPEHEIRRAYDRGQLVAKFEVDQKLLDTAKKGNITAAQQYEKSRQANEIENLKEQMLYG